MSWHLYYTTYGTWLHGDDRGPTDCDGYIPPDPMLESSRANTLKQKPFILTDKMRDAVDAAIREVCEYRNWKLHALNVRTNHIRVIIGLAADRHAVIRDLKAYSTKRLRKEGLIDNDRVVWTKRCGHRYLFDENYLYQAIHYVLHGQ